MAREDEESFTLLRGMARDAATLRALRENWGFSSETGVLLQLLAGYGQVDELLGIARNSTTMPRVRREAAMLLHEMDRKEEAADVLLEGWGKSLTNLGRIHEAIAKFEHALDLDSTLSDSHVRLAELLLRRGEVERATFHYRECLRVYPGQLLAEAGLGVIAEVSGQRRTATGHFQTVLDEPLGQGVYEHEQHEARALALLCLGRATEAEADLRAALAELRGKRRLAWGPWLHLKRAARPPEGLERLWALLSDTPIEDRGGSSPLQPPGA
ncbi:hypothetical protein [Archangium sp.]|uniref:hypothetical protein n=1 Tax=Archangium sp. TaxID=1872627 RepID=UPI002EDA7DAB